MAKLFKDYSILPCVIAGVRERESFPKRGGSFQLSKCGAGSELEGGLENIGSELQGAVRGRWF